MPAMEDYTLKHANRYKKLLSKWTPPPDRNPRSATSPNPDTIVATRIRPMLEDEKADGFPTCIFPREEKNGLVDVHELKVVVRAPYPNLKSTQFQVDRAYDQDSSTLDIYQDVVAPLVPWAWGGGLSTLFAYGQTGSGKTYTVTNLEELVAKDLMSLEGDRKVYLSIIELAGKNAYDLLNDRKEISILEDSLGAMQLTGALEHHVTTTDSILNHIALAATFRRTTSTLKNDTSSRTHSICRFRIEFPPSTKLTFAQDGVLYLIDLAGSEAARDRSEHSSDTMKDSKDINVSLSALKDCIRTKAEWDIQSGSGVGGSGGGGKLAPPHIPFRQNRLTKILKHLFDPNEERTAKTVVMACVNPSLIDVNPSKNTLRFAEMLRVPVPKKGLVVEDDGRPMTWQNEKLKAWIAAESGNPSINAETLARNLSGAQLIRLPAPEFELRCLSTPSVTRQQASAFRAKLWRLHVESQHRQRNGSKPEQRRRPQKEGEPDNEKVLTSVGKMFHDYFDSASSSSRHPDQKVAGFKPFDERVCPGMVVRLKAALPEMFGHRMVVILSRASFASPYVRGDRLEDAASGGERYIAAVLFPGLMPSTYVMNLWKQVVVDVNMMEAEVVLEYEWGTRSYHVGV